MAFTTFALIMAGVSIATSAYSQIKAGKAQKKASDVAAAAQEKVGEHQQEAAESAASISDFNADVAALQEKDATERGAEQESGYRTKIRGAIGAQRAGFAASNIDVSFGSAVDVQGDAAFVGELDALTIRNNAAREAWGFKVTGEDLRMRAKIQRKEGVNAKEAAGYNAAAVRAGGQAAQTAGTLGAIGTIAGGTSSLLQARYGWGRN